MLTLLLRLLWCQDYFLEEISALKKDVTAKCYSGDISLSVSCLKAERIYEAGELDRKRRSISGGISGSAETG